MDLFFPYGTHTLNYPSRGNCLIHVCFFWACPKELGHLSLKRKKLLGSKMLASFFKIPLIPYPPEEKGFLGHGSQRKLLFQKIILPVTFLVNPSLKAWVDPLMFVWNGDAGRIILQDNKCPLECWNVSRPASRQIHQLPASVANLLSSPLRVLPLWETKGSPGSNPPTGSTISYTSAPLPDLQ